MIGPLSIESANKNCNDEVSQKHATATNEEQLSSAKSIHAP